MRSLLRSPQVPPAVRGRPVGRRTAECIRTQECLGVGHPLVDALWASRAAVTQVLAVVAVQVVAGMLALDGEAGGVSVFVAAGVVEAWLGVRLLVLAESRRVACLDLIVGGYPPSAIPAVARQGRWLADPRRRAVLARSIEGLVEMAVRPSGYLAGARPYFSVPAIRTVAPQLRELAALVCADEAPVRGVGLVERLMTCGTSPVYGHEAAPLRAELRRARYLLLGQG
jgi:hypothetical protein